MPIPASSPVHQQRTARLISRFRQSDNAKPARTASLALSISISKPLTISTSVLPKGIIGTAYSAKLDTDGGTAPFTWFITEGFPLPTGLSLDSTTGIISGTPIIASTFSFDVQVNDSSNPPRLSHRPLAITVDSPLVSPNLTITTSSLPGVDVGAPYSATLAASGGTLPYTWTVAGGLLPAGLTLKDTTGIISGTPTTPGTADILIHLVDAVGLSTFKSFSIAVSFPHIDVSIPATSKAAQQTALSLSLKTPYPTDLSGQVTLSFTSNAVIPSDDPMLQFSNGSRIVTFTIPANSLNAVFPAPVMLLTGTVAGTVQMTASFTNGPSNVIAGTTVIAQDAPQMTAVDATLTGNTIVVRVTGYSVNRSVSDVIFGFDVQTASGIQRINAPRSVSADFSTWYQNPQSSAFGSAYVFSQTFTVQGDASTLRSVVVTLSNSLGSSTSASTTLVRK
jgi:hypothetical protein